MCAAQKQLNCLKLEVFGKEKGSDADEAFVNFQVTYIAQDDKAAGTLRLNPQNHDGTNRTRKKQAHACTPSPLQLKPISWATKRILGSGQQML